MISLERRQPFGKLAATSVLLVAVLAAACGKKGAPLAPLYLVPSSVADVSARRVDDRVRLRFVLPSKNENGPGIDLDRVEIYAVTVAAGGEPPPNRELLTKAYLAGRVEVKPPPIEAAEPLTSRPDDVRPSPGDAATFVEPLTSLTLTPAPAKTAAKKPMVAVASTAPPPSASTDPSGSPVVPLHAQLGWPTVSATTASQAVRIYILRGVARNGRSGPPSARVLVPLGAGPDPPGGLSARNTEKAVIVEWLPTLATIGGPLPRYNIYDADSPEQPINGSPIEAPTYERTGASQGTELCFRVRTVDVAGSVQLESGPSDPVCVTPKDVFAPAAPKGFAVVSTPGAVQLIWDANTEADLAGYIVLRAQAADETLQPLTPAPIRDTVFQDATVQAGVRYIYAIVAVDSATPPNRSAPSERVEALARHP